MGLGENIRFLRIKKGLSQDELADKLGYKSYTTIQKWESGVSEPPIKKLKELSEIFNTDMDEIANGDMTDSEQRKIFSKNLNRYMSASNKTQKEIADSIKVSPQTFNTWCRGIALPRMGKVQALADYFGIGKTDLIDEKDDMTKPLKKGISIPVLGRVAAGIPIDAIEEIIDTEEISEVLANTGKFFGLRLHGNSMEPRMCDGDIVIVRAQNDAESGDIVIAIVNGDDATCKRLRKYRDGIELISNNPTYEPMFFSNEEIKSKPVTIVGKVVELRGKM